MSQLSGGCVRLSRQQQQRSYGEFAVNILAKQHPELDRLYIEAMAKQRAWSIEATDR